MQTKEEREADDKAAEAAKAAKEAEAEKGRQMEKAKEELARLMAKAKEQADAEDRAAVAKAAGEDADEPASATGESLRRVHLHRLHSYCLIRRVSDCGVDVSGRAAVLACSSTPASFFLEAVLASWRMQRSTCAAQQTRCPSAYHAVHDLPDASWADAQRRQPAQRRQRTAERRPAQRRQRRPLPSQRQSLRRRRRRRCSRRRWPRRSRRRQSASWARRSATQVRGP